MVFGMYLCRLGSNVHCVSIKNGLCVCAERDQRVEEGEGFFADPCIHGRKWLVFFLVGDKESYLDTVRDGQVLW